MNNLIYADFTVSTCVLEIRRSVALHFIYCENFRLENDLIDLRLCILIRT